MRIRQFAGLSVILGLVFVSLGCQGFRNRYNSNSRPNTDPLFQRDPGPQPGYPPSYPPYPPDPRYIPGPPPGNGAPAIPGSPEVLTPQPYPMDSTPAVPGQAPSSSGYSPNPSGQNPIAGSEITPVPGSTMIDPPFIGRSTQEPPLARRTPLTPPAQKTLPGKLPPDLTDSKTADRAAVTPPVREPEPAPALPVGIPGFAEPKTRVASGLKPDTEGLDWLQTSKYRTVVHLRRAGTDDSADREQVEKRGMKYIPIEMSPETLSRDKVEEFNKIVDNPANYPLFVYDKDGMLSGVMWYLHFRTADKMADDAAGTKAELYGLKVKDGAEQTAYWVAIESLLADKP
jgi:protein tyrosine phosphatase (PTP) superfamily phosphohydrolase (DUF442 family)